MAPCLSEFPSVCLEAIFSHVPLYDLFYSVGLVCTSWHKSRRTALLRRRRLVLIQCDEYDHETLNDYRVRDCFHGTELIERVRRDDGSSWHTLESLEKYKFNCLSVPGGMCPSVPFIASLTSNFINITRLHLNINLRNSVLTQLIRLIEHYSQHLVELKVNGDFYPEGDDEEEYEDSTRELALNMANLIDCINRLQSLRHLNLSIPDWGFRFPLLSCLARLVTFSGYNFGGNWMFASIKRYGQNVTLIKIDNTVVIREISQFNAQLANKFKFLCVCFGGFDNLNDDDDDDDLDGDHQDFNRMQAMNIFFTRFSSLTKFQLFSISDPMTKLARYLSLLTQLVHLDLHFDHIPQVEAVQPEEGEAEAEEQDQREQVQLQITQVPSVRLLSLGYSTKSHHDSERLFIPEIFPNVQVLRLEHYYSPVPECTACEISRDDYHYDFHLHLLEDIDSQHARRLAECKRLTRQPFRHCANLHTVALVDSGMETLISLDDL